MTKPNEMKKMNFMRYGAKSQINRKENELCMRYCSDKPIFVRRTKLVLAGTQTVNIDASWNLSTFDDGKNYKLQLLEYDPPYYDLDEPNTFWCLVYSSQAAIIASAVFGPISPTIVALFSLVQCYLINRNDDEVGEKDNFQSIVKTAKNNMGTLYTWGNSDYKIKFKVQ